MRCSTVFALQQDFKQDFQALKMLIHTSKDYNGLFCMRGQSQVMHTTPAPKSVQVTKIICIVSECITKNILLSGNKREEQVENMTLPILGQIQIILSARLLASVPNLKGLSESARSYYNYLSGNYAVVIYILRYGYLQKL